MIRVEPSLNVKTTLPSLPTIYGLSVLKNDVKLLFLALSELMISFLSLCEILLGLPTVFNSCWLNNWTGLSSDNFPIWRWYGLTLVLLPALSCVTGWTRISLFHVALLEIVPVITKVPASPEVSLLNTACKPLFSVIDASSTPEPYALSETGIEILTLSPR